VERGGGGGGLRGGGGAPGGEMTQALYEHMNNKTIKILKKRNVWLKKKRKNF
jgi:hypothetical protein